MQVHIIHVYSLGGKVNNLHANILDRIEAHLQYHPLFVGIQGCCVELIVYTNCILYSQQLYM